MIKTKLAKKVLSKADQKHLTAMGVNSMAAFIKNRNHQKQFESEVHACACGDCWRIAKKLGVD